MKKVEVLGLMLLIVILLLLFRTKSLADPVSPAPGPRPSSSPAPAGLLVGAIQSKQPNEKCDTKYGANWAEVTPTLCAKTS
jgi:hypothetical protein